MIDVRQATIVDLPDIVPLFDGYRQFYERPGDMAGAHAFLLERVRHAQSVVFLAREGGTPVGFTQLYPSFSSASMARIFVLNDLFVKDDVRGKGVGRSLLGAAAEFGKAAGAVRLTLSTALTNSRAQAVYESLGWQRDQQFCTYNLAL